MSRSLLLIGGARSGKSTTALAVAAATGGEVAIVVTAQAFDGEMTERIARHRAERPSNWTTVEAPIELLAGVGSVADGHVLLLDCMTLWVSNRILADASHEVIEREAEAIGGLLADRSGTSIVVSNEVGHGIVPGDPVSRSFRDVHGRVNQIIARHVDDTYLVVAGRLLPTLDPAAVVGR